MNKTYHLDYNPLNDAIGMMPGETFFTQTANGIEECVFIGIGLHYNHSSLRGYYTIYYHDSDNRHRFEHLYRLRGLYDTAEDCIANRNEIISRSRYFNYDRLFAESLCMTYEAIGGKYIPRSGDEPLGQAYYFYNNEVKSTTPQLAGLLDIRLDLEGDCHVSLIKSIATWWPEFEYVPTYPTAEECLANNKTIIKYRKK